MKNNIKTIIEIVKELNFVLTSKQKRYILILMFAAIIYSGFELLGVASVLPFIQAVQMPEVLMGKEYVQYIMRVFKIQESKEVLMFMGIGLILVYIFKNLYMLFYHYLQYDFSSIIQKELSLRMLHSYMNHSYTFFLNTNSSEILRGCSGDVAGVYAIISNISTIIAEVLTIIAIGVFILYTDFFIAVFALGLMLFVLLIMVLIFKPIMKRAGKKNIQISTIQNQILYQIVSGIKEIFVMQRKEFFVQEYEKISEKARKLHRKYDFINNSPDRIIEGICVSGIIGIVCVRLFIDDSTADFIPKLAIFAMSAFKILPSVGKITSRINSLVYYRPTLENVYNNLKMAISYEDEMERYINEHSKEKKLEKDIQLNKELSIEHVGWKYPNQKNEVLTDASLTIRKGESVAFIGSSGAGKTTLADIILGLLQPQQGTIMMDGIDIYTILKPWARIVGYVPQAVFLMDDTVKNNIVFGVSKEEIQEDLVWSALEKAQLKDFIEGLPNGLETIVGERGIRFSGGQKQRIAIARALYNKPEILVLDEATAALDNETETAVMESIDALQGKITLIIVAHRLTTIRNCDKVYEIKDGKAILRDKDEVLGKSS